jgi:hypothetical protein
MSRRARKRARAVAAGSTATPPPSRSELKNAEARAKLAPLRDGERPRAVTVAAVVAMALVVANLTLAFAGYKIQGKRPALPGVLVFTLLLLVMAGGLWKARYWAVLGFQALLGITMLVFSLRLPFAANVGTVLISLAILIPATALFWFLVKAMARIQMPERR